MKTVPPDKEIYNQKPARLIARVVAYINENIGNDLREKCVSETFRISTSTLRHSFKSYYGISYRTFVERQRMAKARKLIEQDGMFVKEAMHESGYKNRVTFSKAFKRYFGKNPSSAR